MDFLQKFSKFRGRVENLKYLAKGGENIVYIADVPGTNIVIKMPLGDSYAEAMNET